MHRGAVSEHFSGERGHLSGGPKLNACGKPPLKRSPPRDCVRLEPIHLPTEQSPRIATRGASVCESHRVQFLIDPEPANELFNSCAILEQLAW
jgi:hypothetical protein